MALQIASVTSGTVVPTLQNRGSLPITLCSNCIFSHPVPEFSTMARVTVEDCILQVPNRFDLVMLAAQRAREISAGAPLTIDRDNDKNPVVALREIAEGYVTRESINSPKMDDSDNIDELAMLINAMGDD